ncbi:Cysteine desulfurase [Symmachiella macrocystis]|uniref:cysteine desulfurase n=1 Tax=Symmachiella macrocystis TaxID=2527985 RepID=A0A5C6BM03_9PLAN|nr:cysteine desulfurase family protein [Symmachiella macrocystis]TWU13045.1 Cysteine desulfurase [Symmachiella macrocystis]
MAADTSDHWIYLDNNATTRPLPEVLDVMQRHFADSFANPGSRHAAGRAARKVLEASRESIAQILGATPEELIFTSGGTESINLAIRGLVGTTPGTIALPHGEHPATLEACRALQRRGWKLHFLDIDGEGRLIDEQFPQLPWEDLQLVTVILAHNETGVIQDLGPLAALCQQHRVPLHVDAVQAAGKIPVDIHALGVDAMSIGAHKFNGPRGIGGLLIKAERRLNPLIFGGHQEAERRPGTEPVALIAGMAAALEAFHADPTSRFELLQQLRDRLQAGLRERCPPVIVNGSQQHRLPNTLNIAFPGLGGDPLLIALDLEGIACSLGSACASGSSEPAPVLVAMNCPDEVLDCSIRFSVGVGNTEAEMDDAVGRIAGVVNRMRDNCSS